MNFNSLSTMYSQHSYPKSKRISVLSAVSALYVQKSFSTSNMTTHFLSCGKGEYNQSYVSVDTQHLIYSYFPGGFTKLQHRVQQDFYFYFKFNFVFYLPCLASDRKCCLLNTKSYLSKTKNVLNFTNHKRNILD